MPWRFRRARKRVEIDPDEILLDSSNLPQFNTDQMEGRIERPLRRGSFIAAGTLLSLLFGVLIFRAGNLQIAQGADFAKQARENQLNEIPIFADRGIITDRTGTPLAWNEREHAEDPFARRVYDSTPGLSHIVGYVKPPAKDSAGFYYRDYFDGMDGVELALNDLLGGHNGLKLSETNAKGEVVSQSVVDPPVAGQKVALSIDATVTEGLYRALANVAQSSHYQGAAGVIIDVETGELLALTSYPDYQAQALTDGDRAGINAINQNPYQPFLDRATDGLYAPGSIVKPIVAAAALQEGVIDENKQILSTGQISIPNPYDASKPSVFKDWKAHGWVDMRQAIAVSSDVYFYEVGGGFQGQKGLGITKLDQYYSMFGYGKEPGLAGFTSAAGNIPTPEWKAKEFPEDPTWRIGNTYHTAIGQYGMLVSPLQAARAVAAVANGGKLLVPSVIASSTPRFEELPISDHALSVVREGMRRGVTGGGTAAGINFSFVHAAGKSGTAQVGSRNEHQNAWLTGFWPYEKPRYAFAVVLEKGPAGTLAGGNAVMAQFFQFMDEHARQYLQ